MSTLAAPRLEIDVVIPAHDAAETIESAVRSALEQRAPPAEVLVVADACTDDTARRAAALGARVLEVNLRSPGAARNAGVLASRASHIAFLDADDVWLPSWLEAVEDAHARAPDAVFYYGGIIEESDRGEVVRVGAPAAQEGDLFEALLEWNFMATPACVCSRSALLAGGLFERTLLNGEDWDMWLRLAATGRVAAVPGHHVRVRRVPNSVSRSPRHLLRARDDALRVIQRAAGLRPVPPAVLRRSRARVLAFSAMRLLAHDRSSAARIDLRSALELSPLDGSLWLIALLSAAPPRVRQLALAARRRARLLGGRLW